MNDDVTLAEAARILSISRNTLKRHIEEGKLNAPKEDGIHGEYHITREELARVYPKKKEPSKIEELRSEIENLKLKNADLTVERDAWRTQAMTLLKDKQG